MAVICPITDQSWEQHFLGNGWSTPQDQITAGYPVFLQPTPNFATFEQIIDFGSIINNTIVEASWGREDSGAGLSVSPTISYSTDDATWTAESAGVTKFYAAAVRYVRVQLNVTNSNPAAYCRIRDLRVRAATKKKKLAGSGTTNGSGVATVDITGEFLDVSAIQVTAAYNASYGVIAVYDFTDVPNPTSFDVRTYKLSDGTAAPSAPFSWTLEGV